VIDSVYSHLVQSTLFAGAAALLALAFRANRAQVRFWLYLCASLKFLIPFALLSMAGTQIGRWISPPTSERIGIVVPVYPGSGDSHSSDGKLKAAGPSSEVASLNPAILHGLFLGMWLTGTVAVALGRLRGWRQILRLIHASAASDITASVEVRFSPGIMEPGVVGWRRQILLLPQGIVDRLSPSELNAILAHELCHVRRRDNLLALIHMTVEAIFWFHPLVWWIGARLVEERERTCDEDVVSRGNAPDTYAEAIVKVCKWSTDSPLPCVTGVTGGNLNQRIEQIMSARKVCGLSLARKAVLAATAAAVLLAPVLIGIANAPATLAQPASEVPQWQIAAGGQMAFDVASVKPVTPGARQRSPNFALDDADGFVNSLTGESPHGRFSATFGLPTYISFAYKLSMTPELRQAMFARLPKWVETERFEIDAKAAGNPTKDQMRLMMQSLLAERFNIAIHYESQEMPVFVLTLIKPGAWGPKLIRHADGPPCDLLVRNDPATGLDDPGAGAFPARCGSQTAVLRRYGRILEGTRNTTMAVLAGSLARKSGRPVVDRTGIADRIDFQLEWTLESNGPATPGREVEFDPNPLTFLDAVREQLGLKLQPAKAPVRILVIDRIERPSAN